VDSSLLNRRCKRRLPPLRLSRSLKRRMPIRTSSMRLSRPRLRNLSSSNRAVKLELSLSKISCEHLVVEARLSRLTPA
jgi:hypothetical protein